MKILIIEDDPVQALNLKIHLKNIGYYDVYTAQNLSEVHQVINKTCFDVVFCDIHLPDVDGITLLSEHLDNSVAKAIVIISIEDDTILNLVKGMCCHLGYEFVGALQKPLQLESLVKTLKAYESHIVEIFFESKPDVISHIDILTGFQQNHFFSVYQPQFSFETGELVGVEALARFDHPILGVLSPDYFLPTIIEMGLIRDLYTLMLDKSTSALSQLGCNVKLSINITHDLLEQDLSSITATICQTNKFPLSMLTLELTEDHAYNASHKALANIARLRIKGVDFSIDDFGTGYASLEKLVDLPFTELKIDRIFISRVKDDYKHQQLTLAGVRLAQALGLHCIAEGVEDVETWEYLKRLGVDTCQGFYTGKPMSIAELLPLYQVASSVTSVDTKKNKNAIIYVDNNVTRGTAFVRLLSKLFLHQEIVFLSRLDAIHNHVRDLAIQCIIIDGDVMSNMTVNDHVALSSLKQKIKTLALIHHSNDADSMVVKMPYIVKEDNISYYIKAVYDYVSNLDDDHISTMLSKLSEREKEIAKLLLAGFSNKYIAYELNISHKTVSTFKQRILAKLGVKSLLELAAVIR